MKKLFAVLALLAVSGIPTLAQDRGQDAPVFEFGGGYTYRSFNVPFSPRLNMNGWNATAEYRVFPWLSAAADIDGTYKTQTDPDTTAIGKDKTHVYSYLFGPRIYPLGHHKFTPFVHALFGVGHSYVFLPALTDVGAAATTATENDFTYSIGGGLDISLGKHFALRVAKFDYEQTRFYQANSSGAPNQNNFKYSAAFLVKLGGK
jgi:outer membrane protein with beta-barrel domain